MATLELSDALDAVMTPRPPVASKPRTLVEDFLQDHRHHGNGFPGNLEPAELARFVTETSQGPADDLTGYLADGLNDMPLANRPKLNPLVAKFLLGTITVDEQARLNEMMRAAMLAHGATQVECAMQRANVAYAIERKAGER